MNNDNTVRATGATPILEEIRKWMRDRKINIQRWIFRMKSFRAKRNDAKALADAIRRADEQSKRLGGRRLWVLKLGWSDYAVVTKQQVRNFFNSIGMPLNYHQTNEYIVHITRKVNE